MKKRPWLLVPILSFLAFTGLFAQQEEKPRPAQPLPNVLIIGDSISIGYTPHVAEMLKGSATVEHNEGNAQHTGTGLERLDQWVGSTKWDVIHFNWGLWDLCYRNPASRAPDNRDKLHGKLTTSLEQYGRNLEQLVQRLEKTGATLIWAQTTVVPQGEPGRIVGDDKKYNDVAAAVMKKHGIIIDDLYSLTKGFSRDMFVGPGDVHYRPEGYQKIAARVAEKIRSSLKGEGATAATLRLIPLVKESKWNANATVNTSPLKAVITVVKNGEAEVTLSVAYDNGAVWVFDCATDGDWLTIKHTERRKVADVHAGKTNLPPVGPTHGTGILRRGKLTLDYVVSDGNGQPILDVRLQAEPQK
jgi:hypothetical protein